MAASKKGRRVKAADLERLLQSRQTSMRAWHLPEPALIFGQQGRSTNPKTGLTLFGPWGVGDDAIQQIRVAIIGSGETIQSAKHWFERCRGVVSPRDPKMDPDLFPQFPGVESRQGFDCRLLTPADLTETLTPAEVARCVSAGTRDRAVEEAVAVVKARLAVLAEKEAPPDVVLVALPDEVRQVAGAGRTHSKVRRPKRARKQMSLCFLDTPVGSTEDQPISRTLHRAIKAEGMRVKLPTQMAWPSTFTGAGDVEDDATRAWNFFTALYYKAGGIPWRATGLARGTCYIGISFYRPAREAGMLQTSMAQAFSDKGEGLVLRGESFPWSIEQQGAPHLSREHAKRLLAGVLENYEKHLRHLPSRVVLHKSSIFSEDELAGFSEALAGSGIAYHDYLSIGRSSIRFLRVGDEPPIRGTVIEIAPRRYVAYTAGHVPYLRVYPGAHIPNPLSITQHHGSGSVAEVLGEVMALTKLNWNSAVFANADPITLGFARGVGLILAEMPDDIAPANSYRFYM